MQKDIAWNNFVTTGKVEDYLKYVYAEAENADGESDLYGCSCNKRDTGEGK